MENLVEENRSSRLFLEQKTFFLFVVIVSALPILLTLLGVNIGVPEEFNSSAVQFSLPTEQALHYALTGALFHGLLEWSSVVIAFVAAILAFSHYSINRSLAAPIIGIALFCCGIMDGFHTLVAFHVVKGAVPSEALIPFTWAMARGFDAMIIVLGTILCLRFTDKLSTYKGRVVFMTALGFGLMSCLLIFYMVTSSYIPQTQFPNHVITRPFDIFPLLFYVAGLPIFWAFYKKHPSYLSGAMFLSLIPYVMLELHMVFGSAFLFDEHFNAAHILKIWAYLIPLIGLILDFVSAYKAQRSLSRELSDNKVKLLETFEDLKASNVDLATFAYSASHDLKAPLRAVHNLSQWLSEDLSDKLDETNKERLSKLQSRVKRMDKLLNSMLEYSRADERSEKSEAMNCYDLIADQIAMLEVPEGFTIHIEDALKTMFAQQLPLSQVFLNLINNAIKHHDKPQGTITIRGEKGEEFFTFIVSDDGPGIAKEYHDKIFEMFQTLKRRDEVEGSGMGLALVKRIVSRAGGTLNLCSEPGQGACFIFTWPRSRYAEAMAVKSSRLPCHAANNL